MDPHPEKIPGVILGGKHNLISFLGMFRASTPNLGPIGPPTRSLARLVFRYPKTADFRKNHKNSHRLPKNSPILKISTDLDPLWPTLPNAN